MRSYIIHAIAILLAALATTALAQTQPHPGPTKPPPTTSPLSKSGTDINPTTEECRAGWNGDLKWTKEQFESHCEQMKASK
jgi:hypothetical protein